ncbi:hypothetical protein CDAR_53561 [Caerostris darwini]|uniref:Uncharacterized protein n=1 Tax=Caerostris darwini TaxID=1538125 RepID=A0AAV4VSE8_9ARAC|nr:hypothetical protein CDAR_53561 [Caerostris darwini]
MKIQSHVHKNLKLLIMKILCSDLTGNDILKDHSFIENQFNGERPPFELCSLAVAQVPSVSLCANLTLNCRPVATKFGRQTEEDRILE